jgi:hypothetical protein
MDSDLRKSVYKYKIKTNKKMEGISESLKFEGQRFFSKRIFMTRESALEGLEGQRLYSHVVERY